MKKEYVVGSRKGDIDENMKKCQKCEK